MLESLLYLKRAGCDGILTYFAPMVAERLSFQPAHFIFLRQAKYLSYK
jgi:hypothetical protein